MKLNRQSLIAVGLAVVLLLAVPALAGTALAETETETETEADTDTDIGNESTTGGLSIDAAYDNGTVTLTVSENESVVSGANVSVNNASVGETDEDGMIGFAVASDESFSVTVTTDDQTASTTYTINGEEVVDDTDADSDAGNENESDADAGNETDTPNQSERAGPPSEMPSQVPDHVSEIHSLINQFLGGSIDQLGPAVSDAAGNNGNGPAENASPNGQSHADESDENATNDSTTNNSSDTADTDTDRNDNEERSTDTDRTERNGNTSDRPGNAPAHSNAGGR